MASDNENSTRSYDERISFRDIILRLRYWKNHLLSKWRVLLASALIAAVLALTYAFIAKPIYVAQSTFVLDESATGGLGQYASLAALAGISMNAESNGLFAGDNIIELYKSRTMLEKTLLTKCDFNGKPEMLIDRYIAFNHLHDKWRGEAGLENISFENTDTGKLSRLQDSAIFVIVKRIKKKNLAVGKPDKKLGVIDVTVRSKDEFFSKYLDEKLVQNVNAFYIMTRSNRALRNLNVLQQQTDSVRKVMNTYISGAALANDIVPNANPERSILHTGSQKKTVDVQASAAVYAELLKNLELAKITLRKETPLIQPIDSPQLPLETEKPGKVLFPVLGAIIGFILCVFYLVFKKGLSELN
ncbi:MAG TPA: Wzz/FepE/Etk N-terminal domain-containing protein [Mucilaginibacter sp.]|jgi:hypothetical protein|nr:Wzz/FepE/Etk N-terminal domain-containing protein [Mucilaginibacter sp.]